MHISRQHSADSVTAELQTSSEINISAKAVRQVRRGMGFHGHTGLCKPYITKCIGQSSLHNAALEQWQWLSPIGNGAHRCRWDNIFLGFVLGTIVPPTLDSSNFVGTVWHFSIPAHNARSIKPELAELEQKNLNGQHRALTLKPHPKPLG